MKILKYAFILFALIYSTRCSEDVIQTILQNFESKPTKEYFKLFHFLYEKKYELNSEEGLKRYRIFKDNLKIIKEHNSRQDDYRLGVNKFADLSTEEFSEQYLMKPEVKRKQMEKMVRNLREEGYFDRYADDDDQKLFDSTENFSNSYQQYSPINWNSSLGPARNQGPCGSCWTFAITGVLESFRNRKARKNLDYLSTQQLVDCDTNNNGCNGGDFYWAFKYTQTNGLVDETKYPYKAQEESCQSINGFSTTKISDFSYCSNYRTVSSLKCTEDKVYQNLQKGVSAVGIDGSMIQLYEKGIFTFNCSSDNHAVILTGYGVDVVTGKEYFLIRNSWGTSWGENGYIRVARNLNNKNSCFITNESYTITLA